LNNNFSLEEEMWLQDLRCDHSVGGSQVRSLNTYTCGAHN
jgi:hypothetical protein